MVTLGSVFSKHRSCCMGWKQAGEKVLHLLRILLGSGLPGPGR